MENQYYTPEQPKKTPLFKKYSNILKWIWFGFGVLATIIILGSFIFITYTLITETAEPVIEETETIVEETNESECNVRGIILHGDLQTYIAESDFDENDNLLIDASASEDIQYAIEESNQDSGIQAIILEIDSYGGYPVAGEEIANALKFVEKPTVALIRGAGASAAYLAATGADMIFASKHSDVGSIGVSMSYLDRSNYNQEEGLTYNKLSTGKFKDAGDPDKTLTLEERQYFERDLKILLENYIQEVATNRNLPVSKVRQLADGSTMLGEAALKNGLIDKIGDLRAVEQYLAEKLSTDIVVCW